MVMSIVISWIVQIVDDDPGDIDDDHYDVDADNGDVDSDGGVDVDDDHDREQIVALVR